MKIEIKGNLRILTAENGYITQNTESVIDNRIFIKQKVMLPNETENDYKEVESNEQQQHQQQPQISYEQKVSDLIRARYTVDQELAINRQRDTKPEEFKAYFNYCEQCKQKAHESTI